MQVRGRSKRSMVDALAHDIAAGIRDGLSRSDAVDWAWAVNPHATWGQVSQALSKACSIRTRSSSPLFRVTASIASAITRGMSQGEAGEALWKRRPLLSSRQISQAIKRATRNASRRRGTS